MGLPRPRLTIRRTMVAIAGVALLFWAALLARRRQDYHIRAEQHSAVRQVLLAEITTLRRQGGQEDEAKKREWSMFEETRLEGVYRRAMDRPWTVIGPGEGEPRPLK